MYFLRFFNTFVIVTLFLLLYQNYFEDDFYDNVLTNYKSLQINSAKENVCHQKPLFYLKKEIFHQCNVQC